MSSAQAENPGPEEAGSFGPETEQVADAAQDASAGAPREAEPQEAGAGAGQEPSEAEPSLADVLDATAKERDDYLEALRRTQADFENYRKRVLKQQQEQSDRAAEAVVRALLPVLDTLDLAMAHLSGLEPASEATSEAAEASGLSQVGGALLEALAKEGLERVGAQGEPFDPSQHEAVIHEAADDGGEPEILEVLRSGWRWRGRVLRAAMVKVKG